MMTIYVLFGGMTATSWVQIIKAGLLMVGTIVISFLVLLNFNFNFVDMFDKVQQLLAHGESFLHSGTIYKNPLGLISVLIALVIRYSWFTTYFNALLYSKRCENSSFFCYLRRLDYWYFLCINDFPRFWCSSFRWLLMQLLLKMRLVIWLHQCLPVY